MNVSAIVACSKNRAIGRDNQIPWYLPADLRYFKQVTSGHAILMGRKTYESIGRPLPKRSNIVITRQKNYQLEGCNVYHSLLEGVEAAKKMGEEELFIIGGGEIYRQALPICHKIYYTEVDLEIADATVFFPALQEKDWKLISAEAHQKDEKNPYHYTFKVYERTQQVTLMNLPEKLA
jgi:dihydrofolate reductase